MALWPTILANLSLLSVVTLIKSLSFSINYYENIIVFQGRKRYLVHIAGPTYLIEGVIKAFQA